MTTTSLTCPHCSFSKEVPVSSLPPMGTRANCPRCGESFVLDEEFLAKGDRHLRSQSPTPPAEEPAASLPQRTVSFTFTGNAKEYFGIWIVNTLLRIVTLGIYSPWAKVRKRRYFYGNTLLNDSAFDYLADPLSILKGWFIAGAFFGLYSVASQLSPILGAVLMVAFFGVFPWVMVRSMMFNLRNSSHRNIRFAFAPAYREAYRVFLWWQLLIPLTLGVITPYVLYRQRKFIMESSSYGSTGFTFHATKQQFFRICIPLFILTPLMIGSFAALAILQQKTADSVLLALVPAVILPLFYFMALVHFPVALANLTWNSTGIGGHRFLSTLRVRDIFWIYLSNAVAIVFSLGLLAPWASVRLARYRLERLALCGVGDFDSIAAGAAEPIGATGEELGEMFGFDLGL